MPVVGVGVDVVDVARFTAVLRRRPAVALRVFTTAERARPPAGLAARFAAKEALAKSLGVPGGLSWLDAEVIADPHGRPALAVRGAVAAAAAARGVRRWHLSLSHDRELAIALVVAES